MRFIPTHAGNTLLSHPRGRSESVHPHTRGEHISSASSRCNGIGSSPHTRGTHRCYKCGATVTRFIPTHAGNTLAVHLPVVTVSVHPHTRGEHTAAISVVRLSRGSSPHTRGTHEHSTMFQPNTRFIPTHAGNTAGTQLRGVLLAVHPHTRGEHLLLPAQEINGDGSSPHTRGTLRPSHQILPFSRFIPTHAGNTRSPCPCSCPQPVHPHTRGEHFQLLKSRHRYRGSSPHTRGTQTTYTSNSQQHRFIPTHAGNTAVTTTRFLPFPVHPHTRGEHYRSIQYPQQKPGSSPHTRGTHHIHTDTH